MTERNLKLELTLRNSIDKDNSNIKEEVDENKFNIDKLNKHKKEILKFKEETEDFILQQDDNINIIKQQNEELDENIRYLEDQRNALNNRLNEIIY